MMEIPWKTCYRSQNSYWPPWLRNSGAKKQPKRTGVAQEQETEIVAAVYSPQPRTQQRKSHVCLGCDRAQHKDGCTYCPVYDGL